ncbi:MAG: hypothetical protein ACO1O4_08860 [Devosia sp.]
MALKSLGPLAPGVSNAKPALNAPRLCTGATVTTVMDMTVTVQVDLGLEISKAEADLYLNWAGDLLEPTRGDDENGES